MANEWATADTFDAIRLNQKTRFIGTGAQATAFITSPQIGQQVFATVSDSSFHSDKLATYVSTSTWKYRKLVEQSEENQGTINTNGNQVNLRQYVMFTIPSTYKLYKITGIGYHTVGNGPFAMTLGVDVVDSLTTPSAGTMLLGCTGEFTPAAQNTTYTKSIECNFVRGGTIVGAWGHSGSSNAFGCVSGAGDKGKSITYTNAPKLAEATAFTAQAFAGLIIYYRGYS